jgi:hypothetical protein
MIMTTEQEKEFVKVVWDYLKAEGAEKVRCPKPYMPPVPISVCVSCRFIAGVKIPLQYKKPIILCSFPGERVRTYSTIPGIRECRCIPEFAEPFLSEGDQ